VLEDENGLIQSAVNVSSSITIKPTKYLEDEKPFPDPYLLPNLPSQINDAIALKQMVKFEKLCNFRSIVVDTVFHDLKTNFNLL
ncbi:unnamed protein product, partial [Rotaria magnacalcarata]